MSATLISVVFFITTLAISFDNGTYLGDFAPIFLLFIGFLLLFIHFLKPSLFPTVKVSQIAPILLIATSTLSPFFIGGWWVQNKSFISSLELFLTMLLFPLTLFATTRIRSTNVKNILFIAFIVIAAALRIFMLKISPAPSIDVYVILNEAPQKLLQLVNPYNTTYTHVFPGVTPDYYSYWPASFLLQIPFIELFHDPRVLHLFADIVSAVLLFLIGGKTFTAQVLSLIYLYRPLSLYMIEGSWLTPLNFMFITLASYLWKNKANSVLISVSLGLLTAVQFYFGVVFFFFAKLLKFNLKFIMSFFLTIAVITLPFIFASPVRFLDQTIFFYLKNPPPPNVLIHTSLSLNTVFFELTKKDFPSPITFSLIFLLLLVLIINQGKKLSQSLQGITIIFFSVFIFGRQAFVNYYYLVASLLILWLSALHKEQEIQDNPFS